MQIAEKKNFDFVDTIRFIAMVSIVYEHTCIFAPFVFKTLNEQVIQTAILQLGKFGTIIFFLISGFLMSHKFTEYKPGEYLINRFKTTLKPWFIWVLLFFFVIVIDKAVILFRYGKSDELDHFFPFLWERITYIVLETSFWFIPNFLIAIAVLLTCRKYIDKLWFGGILLALSLFYSVNLYYGWIITRHTTALLGFVFYLWLGTRMNLYFDRIIALIKKQPLLKIVLATILIYILSCIETLWLMHLHSHDAFNTLKITNVFYSFAVFALLLKIGSLQHVQRLKPRETTYGIHLIHQILILFLLPMIFKPMKLEPSQAGTVSIYTLGLLHFVRFVIVYSLSYLMALGLSRSKLKWTIGR